MPENAPVPGGHHAQVSYLNNNLSNPMPVQTAAPPPPPEPPTPTHTELPTAVAPSQGHKNLKPGAIAGLTIGLVLGILVLAVLALAGYQRKHRHRRSPTGGEASPGKPSAEEPREAEKSPLVHISKTPHFGPCSKLARPSWTIDRNASPFRQSATLEPPPAPPRPKRPSSSSLVRSVASSPPEGSFLCSPRRPCGVTSAGSIQVPRPSRPYRPPTPYYANIKTYRPGHGIEPFTLSKLEGHNLKTGYTYEVMEV